MSGMDLISLSRGLGWRDCLGVHVNAVYLGRFLVYGKGLERLWKGNTPKVSAEISP